MSAFLEEQVAGLHRMCEALIVHVHQAEGHPEVVVSECPEAVCQRYTEGLNLYTFGGAR